MVKESYKKALEEARKELTELLEKRAEMDVKIARLRQTIGGLSQLCEDESITIFIQDMGLTEACREVLRASSEALTPAEVIKGLERIGFNTGGYSNILAAVHTTLKRMTIGTNPEAIESEKDGKKAYQLKQANIGLFVQPNFGIDPEIMKKIGQQAIESTKRATEEMGKLFSTPKTSKDKKK